MEVHNPVGSVILAVVFLLIGGTSGGFIINFMRERNATEDSETKRGMDATSWLDEQARQWVERYRKENDEIRDRLSRLENHIEKLDVELDKSQREKRALVTYIYLLLAWVSRTYPGADVPPIPPDVQAIIDNEPVNG